MPAKSKAQQQAAGIALAGPAGCRARRSQDWISTAPGNCAAL